MFLREFFVSVLHVSVFGYRMSVRVECLVVYTLTLCVAVFVCVPLADSLCTVLAFGVNVLCLPNMSGCSLSLGVFSCLYNLCFPVVCNVRRLFSISLIEKILWVFSWW